MCGVVHQAGKVWYGHADEGRDNQSRCGVINSRAGARRHRVRIAADFGERPDRRDAAVKLLGRVEGQDMLRGMNRTALCMLLLTAAVSAQRPILPRPPAPDLV